MIHTFEILYILTRREAIYCAYELNKKVNEADRIDSGRIKHFLRVRRIRRRYDGLQFKTLRIPGILKIDLLKYKKVPGWFFLYITIEPEVLLTGENTLDVFWTCPNNALHLQARYAKAIYRLLPKAFEGKPALHQIRFNGQHNIHCDDYRLSNLFMIPYLALSYIARIDFCCNYKISDPDLFVELVKKSYYCPRKKVAKFENLNPYSDKKSNDTLFYDKTSGFCIYNKFDKMMSHDYDNEHNIAAIRKKAKNVIRLEVPYYKMRKEKLKSLTGLQIPDAKNVAETPLKLGPWPFLYKEGIGLKILFETYMHCVMGFKRNAWYDVIQKRKFEWLSYKRFERAINRLCDQKLITKAKKDRIKKMSYSVSRHRSIYEGIEHCDKGTHVKVKNEEGVIEEVEFQLDRDKFLDCWHEMSNFGIMLFRIPRNRKKQMMDATIPFNVNKMVAIGTILTDRPQSIYRILPFKVIRDYDTCDPLEIGTNYQELITAIQYRLNKYATGGVENARK